MMLACWRSSWHRYSIRSNSCPKKLAAPQEQRTAPHTTALPPLLTMTLLTSVSCPPSSNPNRPQFRDSRTNKRFPRSSYCLSNSCLLSSRLRSSPIGEGLWFMRRETSKRVRVRALCGTSLRWIAAEPQPNRSRTAAEPQLNRSNRKSKPRLIQQLHCSQACGRSGRVPLGLIQYKESKRTHAQGKSKDTLQRGLILESQRFT